jgi:hypothetical protein
MGMPGKSKAVSEASQMGTNEHLERMATFNAASMEIFAQACQAYAKGVGTLNGELMGFVNTRLNRDVELSRALSQCGNWSDVVSLQQDWAQQATQEYLAEASRLTDLTSNVAKESWEPVYDRANKVLTEVNKSVE